MRNRARSLPLFSWLSQRPYLLPRVLTQGHELIGAAASQLAGGVGIPQGLCQIDGLGRSKWSSGTAGLSVWMQGALLKAISGDRHSVSMCYCEVELSDKLWCPHRALQKLGCSACSLIFSSIFSCCCCLSLWEQKGILPQMSPSWHLELMLFIQILILWSEPGWSLRREVWLLYQWGSESGVSSHIATPRVSVAPLLLQLENNLHQTCFLAPASFLGASSNV